MPDFINPLVKRQSDALAERYMTQFEQWASRLQQAGIRLADMKDAARFAGEAQKPVDILTWLKRQAVRHPRWSRLSREDVNGFLMLLEDLRTYAQQQSNDLPRQARLMAMSLGMIESFISYSLM